MKLIQKIVLLTGLAVSIFATERELTFHEVEKEKLKRYSAEIVWVEEKESGVIYPRLVSGYSSEKLKFFNQFLEKKQTKKAQEVLEYSKNHQSAKSVYASIGFVSSDLFSLIVIERFKGKDEERKMDLSGILYDITQNRELTLDHILAFSPHAPIQNSKNKKRWFQYRTEVFAPIIRDEIFALKGWNPSEDESDVCRYEDIRHWVNPVWYIAKNGGIQMIPEYNEEMNDCKNEQLFILPLTFLKKYKNKKYAENLETFYQYKGVNKK